jgi:anthranilate phosphoribosyltransferase
MERMQYLVHKVGAGEKASQDLSYDEAREAADLLLSGAATSAQAGGFLVALRVKGETLDEMRAFTEASRAQNRPVLSDRALRPLDIPVYAGKKTFFHAVVPATFLMAACGQPVLLHGFSGIPGRVGAADVLASLGVDTGKGPEEGSLFLKQCGLVYLDVARFNPPLHRFQLLRNELGVRTIFNAVSRMIDPARSRVHLIGISHPPYFESTIGVLNSLGSERILIVRGVEGGPEPSITSQTAGFLAEKGKRHSISFPMDRFDLAWAHRSAAAGGTPTDQAALTEKILSGEVAGSMRDWVLMTAAYGLFASGRVSDLSDGWVMAKKVLLSGGGLEKLNQARTLSKEQ